VEEGAAVTTQTVTVYKYRVTADDGQGTIMKAVFESRLEDIAKALDAFNRLYPGWNIQTFSRVKSQARV
jgi:hypothetical protein